MWYQIFKYTTLFSISYTILSLIFGNPDAHLWAAFSTFAYSLAEVWVDMRRERYPKFILVDGKMVSVLNDTVRKIVTKNKTIIHMTAVTMDGSVKGVYGFSKKGLPDEWHVMEKFEDVFIEVNNYEQGNE